MDKRLNQIQTGTLTEGRMNEDFVFWLKTSGLNILLVVLLIGCGYMGWHWWQRTRNEARADAWRKFEQASTPQDLAVVAVDAAGVDSVAILAKLRAADTYLESITSGVRFDRDAKAEDAKVTPELRVEWLDNADQLFLEVSQSASAKTAPRALLPAAFHAVIGRAAVAEARGDAAAARRFLEEAALLAGSDFAPLGEVARKRAETVEVAALGLELPPLSALPTGSAGSGGTTPPFAMPDIPGLRITPTDPNQPREVPINVMPTPGAPGSPSAPSAPPAQAPSPAPAPAAPPAPSAPSAAPAAPSVP